MFNPLDKAREFLSNAFSKRSNESVLGIDIGSSSVKIVQLRKRQGTAVLETYGELALGPYANLEIGRATKLPPEQLTLALTDLIREANVTSSSTGFAIPFSSSLVSLIKMPAIDDEKLAEMIPIEARKYIPVPINEVTLDWFVIPEDQQRFLEGEEDENKAPSNLDVLLVAIHNDILNQYQDLARRAQLSISFYEIEIFSTIRAAFGQETAPVLIIDMGAASTKVYVVEYGIIRSSHLVNKGGQDITLALSKATGVSVAKAEELKREQGLLAKDDQSTKESILLTLEYVFSESNRVLLNYQKKFNKNVGQVILTGGGAVLKGLSEHANKHFDTEVTLADPFAKIETPAFLEDTLRSVGPEFAVAVGVALRRLREED